jgi:hypothetical protein
MVEDCLELDSFEWWLKSDLPVRYNWTVEQCSHLIAQKEQTADSDGMCNFSVGRYVENVCRIINKQ